MVQVINSKMDRLSNILDAFMLAECLRYGFT